MVDWASVPNEVLQIVIRYMIVQTISCNVEKETMMLLFCCNKQFKSLAEHLSKIPLNPWEPIYRYLKVKQHEYVAYQCAVASLNSTQSKSDELQNAIDTIKAAIIELIPPNEPYQPPRLTYKMTPNKTREICLMMDGPPPLETLPGSLFWVLQHSGFDYITISNTGITYLPEEIGKIKVKDLDFSNNELKGLPDSIHTLRVGGNLNLSHNRLEALPDNFHMMKIGRNLDLSHNRLKSLPANFGKLKLCEGAFLSLTNNLFDLSIDDIRDKLTEIGQATIRCVIHY
jgi:hypothetical protein